MSGSGMSLRMHTMVRLLDKGRADRGCGSLAAKAARLALLRTWAEHLGVLGSGVLINLLESRFHIIERMLEPCHLVIHIVLHVGLGFVTPDEGATAGLLHQAHEVRLLLGKRGWDISDTHSRLHASGSA
jgi:hypothetical protein